MTNTNIRLVTSQLMVTVLTRKVLLKSVYILRKIINPSVSRLVDMLIAKMDDPTHKVIENAIPELELPNSKKGKPMEETNTKVSSNGKQRLRISMFVISCFLYIGLDILSITLKKVLMQNGRNFYYCC